MTADDLRDVLLALPERTFIGTTLVQDTATAGFFPADVPRDRLREAVVEMVDYSEACQAAVRRLRDLTPIPLAVDLPEVAL